MAFQKKVKTVMESRPQGCLEQRKFNKIANLHEQGDQAARQELKRMQEQRVPKAKSSLGQYWNPNGNRIARGSEAKARKINKGYKAKNSIPRGVV